MFNSPIAFCVVCRDWIALDEGAAACTAHVHCEVSPCPQAYVTSASLTKCSSSGVTGIDPRRSELAVGYQQGLQLPQSGDDSTAVHALSTRHAVAPW